jgi:hypothetical protein
MNVTEHMICQKLILILQVRRLHLVRVCCAGFNLADMELLQEAHYK